MKIQSLRLVGIRCFDDTGEIALSPTCNVFVGQNNAGKSTILRAILVNQGFPLSQEDRRPGADSSYSYIKIPAIDIDVMRVRELPPAYAGQKIKLIRNFRARESLDEEGFSTYFIQDYGWFENSRPSHYMVPFIAKRKAVNFNQNISFAIQNTIDGTFSNLYSRIDLLATAGHPKHDAFQAAIRDIIGVPITTRASEHGKQAGFYFDQDHFVTLEQMGDGVTEMAALIVELCLESNKLFVIEEPETNLHPRGLKSLLSLVRESWDRNQIVIATHSNIVVRELAFDDRTKVFKVARSSSDPRSASEVEELSASPLAHADLLKDLGYDFGDLGLHDAWLFLEESSAEQVIRELLVPWFSPDLRGRLRTFSAAGADNLEPAISEFQRLITFVHLQPVYAGRTWIRADGDATGQRVIQKLRAKFAGLTDVECNTFEQPAFEAYYPMRFKEAVDLVAGENNKEKKRKDKADLLREVLTWSKENPDQAKLEWLDSAAEPIGLLRIINESIMSLGSS